MRSKQTKPENLNENMCLTEGELPQHGKLKYYLVHFHPPSISIGKHFILGDTCRLHLVRLQCGVHKKSEKFKANSKRSFPSAARLLKKYPISRRYPVDWTRMAEYSYMTQLLLQRCTAEIFLRPRNLR